MRKGSFMYMVALIVVLSLWGCVGYIPPHIPPTPNTTTYIGTLKIVSGSNVFVNKRRTASGRRIYSGDNVSTGPGAKVYIQFPGGGYIYIDENTDPDFRKWFERGKCIIEAFFRFGRAYEASGGNCELWLGDEHLEAVVGSTEVNFESREQSILTVIKGRVRLRRPAKMVIGAAHQVVVDREGVRSFRALSREELDAVTQWRYPRSARLGWCCVRNQVFESTPDRCSRQDGYFSFDRRDVQIRCQRVAVHGFCCRGGKVFEAERSVCIEQGGSFYRSYRDAKAKCQRPRLIVPGAPRILEVVPVQPRPAPEIE